ncbi:MAG: hypothetical protein J6B98_01420 [Bacilli bacterium]|nr:hypothetical protein [Bacilli bacterium]
MKEAAGEANMTVITIILIGVIAAIAIPLVRNAMTGVNEQACCNSAGGVWDGGQCTQLSGSGQNSFNQCIADTDNDA